MKLNCNSFFDVKREFRELNLNKFYRVFKFEIPDPRKPEQIQESLNTRLNLCLESYGGYGEDRKDIWANTYMKKTGKFIHLGIDIQMPVGTKVYAPFDCEVVDNFTDTDTKIGWGGRLILKVGANKTLLVLAHLEPSSLIKERFVKKGQVLGTIGTWPTNGNTFQHLHVQAITHRRFKTFDGYGTKKDLTENPNPFTVDF